VPLTDSLSGSRVVRLRKWLPMTASSARCRPPDEIGMTFSGDTESLVSTINNTVSIACDERKILKNRMPKDAFSDDLGSHHFLSDSADVVEVGTDDRDLKLLHSFCRTTAVRTNLKSAQGIGRLGALCRKAFWDHLSKSGSTNRSSS
jgi:hypothetical protein